LTTYIFWITNFRNFRSFIILYYRKSVDLCQQIEATGISFITVHGRTAIQKNQPIDQECIKLINESVGVPVILNGDVKNLSDAISMHEYTGCKGITTISGARRGGWGFVTPPPKFSPRSVLKFTNFTSLKYE
jgi:tRNA-dihydrouridine synthase